MLSLNRASNKQSTPENQQSTWLVLVISFLYNSMCREINEPTPNTAINWNQWLNCGALGTQENRQRRVSHIYIEYSLDIACALRGS